MDRFEDNWKLLACAIIKRCLDDVQEKEMCGHLDNVAQVKSQALRDLETGKIDWLLELLNIDISSKEILTMLDNGKEIEINFLY